MSNNGKLYTDGIGSLEHGLYKLIEVWTIHRKNSKYNLLWHNVTVNKSHVISRPVYTNNKVIIYWYRNSVVSIHRNSLRCLNFKMPFFNFFFFFFLKRYIWSLFLYLYTCIMAYTASKPIRFHEIYLQYYNVISNGSANDLNSVSYFFRYIFLNETHLYKSKPRNPVVYNFQKMLFYFSNYAYSNFVMWYILL